MVGKRILRKREVLERLGIRKTTLHETFIKTGRLRLVKIGARAVGIIEDDDDRTVPESESKAVADSKMIARRAPAQEPLDSARVRAGG